MHLISNNTGFLLQTMLYLANHKLNNTLYDTLHNKNLEDDEHLHYAETNEIKCYGVYGCFPLSEPWVDEKRPIAYYPLSPMELDVRYPVFNKHTRDIPKFIDINDPDHVKTVGINTNGNIYFITHGYIEAGDRPWVQNMVNTILDNDPHGTATCIVVDWRGGSSPPYTQTTANIRLVGAITAHIIHLIYEELNLKNIDRFHLIGHSLGSHLCGYAGYYLQKDFGLHVGRITGLDPAEPLFSDTDPLVRLDPTDAKYVDVIHTDAAPFVSSGGLGLSQPIGHVDFYPNGGHDQPGCKQSMRDYIEQEDGSFFWGVQQFLGCNHIRSHQFFTESVLSTCPFMAITCESYEKFQRGDCFECDKDGNFCIDFGFRSQGSYRRLIQNRMIKDNRPIKAFLLTNSHKPFCRTHYKITMKISNGDESITHGGEVGLMSFTIFGQNNENSDQILFSENAEYLEPGHGYTAVVPGKSVGVPHFAILNWEYRMNPLNPFTWRILKSPRVYVDHIIIQSLEHRSRIRLCPPFEMPVVAGEKTDFRAENCRHLPEYY